MATLAKIQTALLVTATAAAVAAAYQPLPNTTRFTVLAVLAIAASVIVVFDLGMSAMGERFWASIVASLLLATAAVVNRNLDAVVVGLLFGAAVAVWLAAGQGLLNDETSTQKALQGPKDLTDAHDTGPAQWPTYPARRASKTFDDVLGMSKLKVELLSIAQEICHAHPGKRSPMNGILLHGEPGTGKTMIAEALAGQIGLPFLPVTIGDVASRWVNETTAQLQQVFTSAIAQAPCVLFFDEIDSSLIDRSSVVNGDSESTRITNALLTNLVDVRGKGVIVIAATNHLNKLDAAGIREGRFDYKVEVPPPDKEARLAIMLTRVAGALDHAEFDYDAAEILAARWEGFSAARLARVCAGMLKQHGDMPNAVYSFDEWTAALRTVQGTLGDALPESTVMLDKLIQTPSVCAYLTGLARRMVNSARIEALGGSVPSGLLLVGAPGTGKSKAVQALAKTTGWALLQTTGGSLPSPDAIDRLLRRAKDIRPVIIFLDEADDLLGLRAYAADRSLCNHLLTAMDGAGGQIKDILWIAATNHPELLDPAALRGGRFTDKLLFPAFDRQTMTRFVSSWLTESSARFATNLTAPAVADLIGPEPVANAVAILRGAVDIMLDRSAGGGTGVVCKMDIAAARTRILRPLWQAPEGGQLPT
ncbi:ATP-dependent zinc metalloprotease FtsH [Cupriavidus laharis]|uniref:ATP-dependent zinc metalloprotease FtsH n=1 Tax=Cupriavidus laharis TaxID=151654 RepID=A0ABN7YI15_9BURK|nr:AAA family ATPase [Cupriavidus laharis]CAG9172424.1 ATP-dependent zinc metalloprotease FtsH [Cupriavidus laharis]